MKKSFFVGLGVALLLAGCAPQFDDGEEEIVQDKAEKTEKAIIPKYQISDDYYKMLLPFEASQARGLVVSNLNTRYDIEEFETGLMRISQKDFNQDKYYFKEGQVLDSSTISKWLERKYTNEQLTEKKLKSSDNLGLNPIDTEKGDIKTRNEKNPIYLAHILEHDYLIKNKDNQVSLGGVVIGLALNSVHYYQKEEYGATYDTSISDQKIESEGKKIAAEVLKRLRKTDELKDVPITIALFKQVEKSSVIPGSFMSFTHVSKDGNSIGKWENVEEKYYVLPSTDAEKEHRDDVTMFKKFKQDVEEYFPNFNGVVGRAFYVDDQLQDLNIEIPIQFYGNSEAIGFTQYLTGLVMEHFPDYVSVQVSVTSVNGPEALVVKKAGEDEPFVHIYK